MNIYEKLLTIQKGVDKMVKDGENQSDKYKYASSETVLNTIRPLMNELGLLLLMSVASAKVSEGQTKSGTTRFFTEMYINFEWVDVETGDKLMIPFYSQGTDLAGEKSPGKALTYAEKMFLLKQFHVPTVKDDPDNDGRTKTGEQRQAGTQAAKETANMQRKGIMQMLGELYGNDAEKIKAGIKGLTSSAKRGVEGVEKVEDINEIAVAVVYGKAKDAFQKRTGKVFVYKPEDGGATEE